MEAPAAAAAGARGREFARRQPQDRSRRISTRFAGTAAPTWGMTAQTVGLAATSAPQASSAVPGSALRPALVPRRESAASNCVRMWQATLSTVGLVGWCAPVGRSAMAAVAPSLQGGRGKSGLTTFSS